MRGFNLGFSPNRSCIEDTKNMILSSAGLLYRPGSKLFQSGFEVLCTRWNPTCTRHPSIKKREPTFPFTLIILCVLGSSWQLISGFNQLGNGQGPYFFTLVNAFITSVAKMNSSIQAGKG